MAADTSSAPAANTLDVGPNAAELASPSAEPIFARSVAAAATYSGAAITYDMWGPQLIRTSLSVPLAIVFRAESNAISGSAEVLLQNRGAYFPRTTPGLPESGAQALAGAHHARAATVRSGSTQG